MPATTLAQAPAWTSKECTVTSTTGGMMTVWKIKGKATVSNIPATRNVYVRFQFQRKLDTDANYSNINSVDVATSTTAAGSVTLETDYEILAISPPAAAKYRFVVTGTYDDDGMPPLQTNLPNTNNISNVVTPVP